MMLGEKTGAILALINRYICSPGYKDLINKQNSRWHKHLYPVEKSLLPAAGINYEALTQQILDGLRDKFGQELAFTHTDHRTGKKILRKKLVPQPVIRDVDGIPLNQEICQESDQVEAHPITNVHETSFLPDDIDVEIRRWLGSERTIDEFFYEINNEYSIFPDDNDDVKSYIILDIFFTALETKMKSEGAFPEIKGFRDYYNSPYIPPEFLRFEMSSMLPCYKYSIAKDELNAGNQSRKSTLYVEHTEKKSSDDENFETWNYPLVNYAPLNFMNKTFESNASLSSSLTKIIERKGTKPFRILKCVYPLYLFLYNNIISFISLNTPRTENYTKGKKVKRKIRLNKEDYHLKEDIILYKGMTAPINFPDKSESDPFKATGCKPTHFPQDKLTSLEAFLHPFSSFNIHPLKRAPKTPDYRKYFVASQFYAIKSFRDYLDDLENRRRNALNNFDFDVSYEYKERNCHQWTNEKLGVKCNTLFTLWMFVRHSELFHIALMPRIENIYKDMQSSSNEKMKASVRTWAKIDKPQNFFTAFFFNANVFLYYPNFHKGYNRFVKLKAEKIFNKFSEMPLQEWLTIATDIEKELSYWNGVSMKFEYYLGLDKFKTILSDFSKAINLKSPLNYDEKKFNHYFMMASEIKS